MMRPLSLWIAAFLLALILIVIATFSMRFAMSPYMFTSIEAVPNTEVALVLGASVRRGQPSPILAFRADAAIALYKAHKVEKILVTGDNGTLEHDEVTPVRKYLIDAGIPAKDIFLDHAGFDTYSSMYRARDVFKVDTMTIVTQDFHMPRALFTARHLGMTAYGFVADGNVRITHDYVREVPASLKALMDLVYHRRPQYLGAPIPLTGVGTTTWY